MCNKGPVFGTIHMIYNWTLFLSLTPITCNGHTGHLPTETLTLDLKSTTVSSNGGKWLQNKIKVASDTNAR